ncbi:MAG TPA: bifunctional DNA-formamidopyrimidine glycosylase/DNA-(apurinic or apyrimidinic site) lyase [Verrucomicrobiae bacterium]|nr:bifunctional DNA-formamidopyrimidine glycosylase/DNA-(apurinic or apyrimidinic site) lyase [Verrucomicrobiae bacterium]
MPELPEVEVLLRHLAPLVRGRTIRNMEVRRVKVLRPTSPLVFKRTLAGARFEGLSRRGKYLLFHLRKPVKKNSLTLLGHLGMTGKMYLLPTPAPLPKHASVVLYLNKQKLVLEDTRYFGRLTLDTSVISRLGPEPLGDGFTAEAFAAALKRSAQSIKVKLLDQSLVAGIGNIYASEALFRARISPKTPARKLKPDQIRRLRGAIRATLREAINCGSTVQLNFGTGKSDGLFYFGRAPGTPDYYEERLRVYDRAGKSCPRCGTAIKQIVQGARSTFFCPKCQHN